MCALISIAIYEYIHYFYLKKRQTMVNNEQSAVGFEINTIAGPSDLTDHTAKVRDQTISFSFFRCTFTGCISVCYFNNVVPKYNILF